MESKNKAEEKVNDGQKGSNEQYQRQENEPEREGKYSADQGEDENGEKPSADEQD